MATLLSVPGDRRRGLHRLARGRASPRRGASRPRARQLLDGQPRQPRTSRAATGARDRPRRSPEPAGGGTRGPRRVRGVPPGRHALGAALGGGSPRVQRGQRHRDAARPRTRRPSRRGSRGSCTRPRRPCTATGPTCPSARTSRPPPSRPTRRARWRASSTPRCGAGSSAWRRWGCATSTCSARARIPRASTRR